MQKKIGKRVIDIVLSIELEQFLSKEKALTKFIELFDVDFHLTYSVNKNECNFISTAFLWSGSNEFDSNFDYWSRLDDKFHRLRL